MNQPTTPFPPPRTRHRRAPTIPFLVGLAGLVVAAAAIAQPSPTAMELRDTGYAELENEKDAEAETTFRKLIRAAPRDPIGHANLAISLLRQQKQDEALEAIDEALKLAPARPDLLAIRADVLAWSGRTDQALDLYRQAFRGQPNDPELAYALFRHAATLRETSDAAQAAFDEALEQLVRLRPDNLVVLLEHGQRAIERDDRAAASQTYLRVRELIWALEPRNRQLAERVLPRILSALESGETEAARVPSLQLGNVLRASGRYKSSLVDLYDGIQGIPVDDFVDEPASISRAWGPEVAIRFEATSAAPAAGARSLVAADWTGDDRADLAWTTSSQIRVQPSQGDGLTLAGGGGGLLLADLLDPESGDSTLDLVVPGNQLQLWQGSGSAFASGSATRLASRSLSFVQPIDFDSDGDLDLVAADSNARAGLTLLRNAQTPELEDVGADAFSELPDDKTMILALRTVDLDRDGDHDILALRSDGLMWIDNLRQGSFRDRSRAAGLSRAPGARDVQAADLDNDGDFDLVLAGIEGSARSFQIWRASGGVYRRSEQLEAKGDIDSLVLADLDNDGLLDLALATSRGLQALLRTDDGWRDAAVTGADGATRHVQVADADADGDLDLFAVTDGGIALARNDGGNANRWLRLRLRGLTTGNDKNNAFGYGVNVEIRSGDRRQVREASGPVTHIGLGREQTPDVLRVVWNNGVPQNRLRPESNQQIVEEQVLKGSCPFLYTWTGDGFDFVTDLLWGAPIGMPVAEGVFAEADPHELVVVRGAVPRDGAYELRITEELWEAAYFDQARLWVVDHPVDTEATSSLRVFPGPAPSPENYPDRVLLASDLRPVRAWDGRGREVTEQVATLDHVYADGYEVADYQGISAPWTFTMDLGTAPAAPVRLVMDGWIFPSDASINVAASQRDDIDFAFTRLEAEIEGEWRALLDPMGFPAGKTKTMIVDTPTLPEGTSRLRIVTSRWLHWDRIAWTPRIEDDRAVVVARLEPDEATLRARGFSQIVRRAPNAPHEFDYDRLQPHSPWILFAGRYTGFGDVLPLIRSVDGGMVVMAAGDEMALRFDASELPPVADGHRRTLFLESYGWDKDADRNTRDVDRTWPLPTGTAVNEGRASERWLTRHISRDLPADDSP